MSPGTRAFYGALVGAFAVLLLSPVSRVYFSQGFWFVRHSPSTEVAAGSVPQENVVDLVALSRTVRACLINLTSGESSTDDPSAKIKACTLGASKDPDNAFWRQAESVLKNARNDRAGAVTALKTASFATRWNDYSVESIAQDVDSVLSTSEQKLAWCGSLEQSLKSEGAEKSIVSYLRGIAGDTLEHDTATRLIIFRNAKLIRDGSRSATGSMLGIELMELIAYGPTDVSTFKKFPGMTVSPKALASARSRFVELATKESKSIGDEIEEGYRRNDAWSAFVDVDDATMNVRILTALSIVTSSLPGAFVSIGLVGAIVLALGLLLRESAIARTVLTPPWNQILSVCTGVGVYLATSLAFPAIWATVSLASFGVRQDKNREGVPSGYGAAYGTSLSILAISFSIVLGIYFVSISPAGGYLGPEIGLDNSLTGSGFALLGLTGVILSLALVTGSVWGFLLRVPSERLAAVSLMRFGAFVCLGCFAAGILVAPISIAADKIAADRIDKIFQHESNFYLTQ